MFGDKFVNKKRIIIIAATGLISFGGAFGFGWFTRTHPKNQNSQTNQSIPTGTEPVKKDESKLPQQPSATGTTGLGEVTPQKNITEKQLNTLVCDLQEKMQDYDNKLKELEARGQRLQVAHSIIKKDVEELGKLQVELASAVTTLKEQRDKLLKSRLEIAKAEKANLMAMSATYDKMDPSSAGKILTNMSKMPTAGEGGCFDDTVKILYYMTDRTKAKLLAEMASSEPKLAAALCQRLKQIVEKE